MRYRRSLTLPPLLVLAAACGREPATETPVGTVSSTCTGTFPSYWQDPAPKFSAQWAGQTISDAPPSGWSGPVFRLSDDYPRTLTDEAADQPWRDARFNALFDSTTSQATRTQLAQDYAWAVMRYIQEGNIGSGNVETDWTLCANPVRRWYHMPFQTYDALSGREFVHGLTREAPVSFSVQGASGSGGSNLLASTMWAVGFFNPTAAYTIGTVWQADGTAQVPADNLSFAEGAVVGKLLFNTLSPDQLPFLANMPAWTANISATSFCQCHGEGGAPCTMAEQSQQCPRTPAMSGVHLLQFDIAVKDSRAPGTQWVFGTFVADGVRKAAEPEPWNRISPLGLMWGNDTPPDGAHAQTYPADPRQNGFMEEVIFWDVVDMLNSAGGSVIAKRPGHLGCNSRLNGPADNANSSCMSCHGTASVPDTADHTPPIIAQFQRGLTQECVVPFAANPGRGLDAAGDTGTVSNGVSFSAMDGIYFHNTPAGRPVNMTAQTAQGPVNVLGTWPLYANGRTDWISVDYSLQLSISITQWLEWLENQAESQAVFDAMLPGR